MKRKTLSLLLAMTMLVSMVAFPASATDGHCTDSDCPVCEVADLINALPAAEDITVDNAATVTDQIHAIDRIKYDLTDDEYDELLLLVETSESPSGGLAVPTRYIEAVSKVEEIGDGGWFAVSKKFTAEGATVDAYDAQVKIKVKNVDTGDTYYLTLATIADGASYMSSEFYSANPDYDGWTYKYVLPAGTYTVEETDDYGATVDGEDFVTTYTAYNGEVADYGTFTVSEGSVATTTITNAMGHVHPVCGASCQCDEGHGADTYEALTDYLTYDGETNTYSGSISAGKYYLNTDVTLSEQLTVSGDVDLCLNGHKLSANSTGRVIKHTAGVLNITDCNGDYGNWKFSDKEITADDGCTLNVWELDNENGTHEVQGGIITGGYVTEGQYEYESDGAGIYSVSALNLYGGTIVGNYNENAGGGIYCTSDFNMYGGAIAGNCSEEAGAGVFAYDNTANIYGGEIVYNNGHNYGGGIYGYWADGLVNIYGGKISNNKAVLGGGGVSIYYASLTIHDGEITNNESNYNGGGVYAYSHSTVFTMYDGTITGNKAVETGSHSCEGGGGIGLGASQAYIYGGTVTGNSAPNGGGIYLQDFNGSTATLCSSETALVVSGNTDTSGKVDNVWVEDAFKLTVEEGITLNPNTVIGIHSENEPTYESPIQITDGGASVLSHFTSDRNNVLEVTADGLSIQERGLANDEFRINLDSDIKNGSIKTDKKIAKAGEAVTITATAAADYKTTAVTVTDKLGGNVVITADAQNQNVYTFTMPEGDVTVSAIFAKPVLKVVIPGNFVGGTVTTDKTQVAQGETITLTATPVSGYEFASLTVTDANGDEVPVTTPKTRSTAVNRRFTMPASDVTVDAVFAKKTVSGLYTVEAVVDKTATTDRRNTEGMDVYADDTVEIDIVVNGADYTNADWELVYDYGKFEFVEARQNDTFAANGYYTLDNATQNGVLKGTIRGVAGNQLKADEFTDGDVVVTYVFKALPQIQEVTGKFTITSAHVNNYEMAGIQDNTAAATSAPDVTIILVTDEDESDDLIPAGKFEDLTVPYNALAQSGNAFELDDAFEDATVTYAAATDGTEVADMSTLDFRTNLPTWTDVGSYTYYAKISGDGLATVYDSAVLTIEPISLTPSATFAVDPAVDSVTITPVLEGVIDGSHKGTVTVAYTDVNGAQTREFDASTFTYDGESTSTCTPFEVQAPAYGAFDVTITYTAATPDNYQSADGNASVDVDKLTASNDTVKALEDAITSEYQYDSTEHGVDIDNITGITPGTWTVDSITDVYTGEADPTVTNVGDDKLVKVVYTDTSDNYNEVVVYVVLKVNPANVKITVDDKSKAKGAADPELTGKVEILDAEGKIVLKTDEYYGTDDLKVEYTRDPGEDAGTYNITASYVPDNNYKVIEIVDGTFTIDAPAIDGPDAQVKIEVVDLSNTTDGTPDYIAGKRLVLVYTNLDKAYFGYGDATNYEKLFDVTEAGYKYVDNDYSTGALVATGDNTEYKHVYGIVVDAVGVFEATEEHEALYKSKIIFLGSDAQYAPENVVYDADINLTGELDVNDYSMNNGIYNVAYDRVSYIRSILKADYNHDKIVDTTDSLAVKDVVDTAKVANP